MSRIAAVTRVIVLVVAVGIGGYLFGGEVAVGDDNARLREILCLDVLERRQASEAGLLTPVSIRGTWTGPLLEAHDTLLGYNIERSVPRLEDNILMANHEIQSFVLGLQTRQSSGTRDGPI